MLLIRDDRKVSIIGGILLLGLTLTTGITVYSAMRQEIESVLGRGLDVALQGKALLLETQIESGLADTHALALRPFIVQAMKELNVQPDNRVALNDLKRNVDSFPQIGFTAVAIYDISGNPLSQVGNFSEKKAQSLLLSKYDSTYLIWDTRFILHTSTKVFDQDMRYIGSIQAEMALPQLTRSFTDVRSIGETAEFVLCSFLGGDGQEMACIISQVDNVRYKSLKRVMDGNISPKSFALEGKSGVITTKDYRDIPVIEAYASLYSIGLGMAIKLDQEELFTPVTKELKDISIYLAALIIAEILLLNWFVKKLIDSEREARDARDTAEQFSIELSHKESELRERLKEITCLYEIRRSLGPELSIDVVCKNIVKYLIPAMQHPEHAFIAIELDNRCILATTTRHEPMHCLSSQIRVSGKPYGQLNVLYPMAKPFLDIDEQRLIDAVTTDLARWLERKQVDELLQLRLKEITCLYEIRRSMGMELAIEDVCQIIFKYLIPAMQFPENAIAVIELNDRHFISDDHALISELSIDGKGREKKTAKIKRNNLHRFMLRSSISLDGREYGFLSVIYKEDKPFLLPEEQKLVDAVASDLQSWLELRRLEQALVSVAEEQAHTLGQELHDNVGQKIAAISYQARVLEKKVAVIGDEDATVLAAAIASQTQTAVAQIKRLAQGLLPFELEANGLVEALQKLAGRISSTYDINCKLVCNYNAVCANSESLNLYRIAQEAINNAIRHGKARNIIITLDWDDERNNVLFSISDDGCGFAVDVNQPATAGMGIKIMQYRAKQLGAKLTLQSSKEGGAEVFLEMRTTKNVNEKSKSNARR
ncbi:MAG: ATP-binding protein [Nitrosomonas sp.]|nr:MAG: ATP-binding protein [Nitrosomonas sp.]